MKPDDICEKYSGRSVGVNLKLLQEDGEGLVPSVLIEGPQEALKMLGELLLSVASEQPGSSFALSPSGAGRFHFSQTAELGLYIHHAPSKRSTGPK